jgi:hypothetical protein
MTLTRLRRLVADEGGLLAQALRPEPVGDAPHGELVARGPRAAGHAADLALVAETVREGYLAHYGTPRVLDGSDRDLCLLAGDALYAAGLQRLAAAGDQPAVTALADLIALGAQAWAADDADLADAAWAAGMAELGWGPSDALSAAKAAARAGDPEAPELLRACADRLTAGLTPGPRPDAPTDGDAPTMDER